MLPLAPESNFAQQRILLEAILRITRHGRMIHTRHHAELVEIAHATVLLLRAIAPTADYAKDMVLLVAAAKQKEAATRRLVEVVGPIWRNGGGTDEG